MSSFVSLPLRASRTLDSPSAFDFPYISSGAIGDSLVIGILEFLP